MTDSSEIDDPTGTPKQKPYRRSGRSRLLALSVAVLFAATAAVAFSAGSASAQSEDRSSVTNQQQADATAPDDTDRFDGTCDPDGIRRGATHSLGKHLRFAKTDALTELLGIDAGTLRQQLKGGSTLADIATSQGVDVSDVVDALVTALGEKAAEHNREIHVDELTAKIIAIVNGERPERPEGEERRHSRRGMHRGGKGVFGTDAA